MRFLLFFMPCAVAGYVAYPYLNTLKNENPQPNVTFVLLNSVSKDEIVGSWALSPRSTGLLAPASGLSGRRAGISLEAWGGGHANFIVGERHIDGPIAWHTKAGVGNSPATLHINSADDKIVLQFTQLENRLVLIAEADSVIPGKRDHIRFLKAS